MQNIGGNGKLEDLDGDENISVQLLDSKIKIKLLLYFE
jgi:hypothetical protein